MPSPGASSFAMHALRKPRMRVGAYGYGGGPIHWKDEELEPLRLRFVTVDGETGEVINEQTPSSCARP